MSSTDDVPDRAAVQKVLAQLPERDAQIVRRRFGLDDGEMRTIEDVGREFAVSPDTIRAIEAETLARLHIAKDG